MVTTPMFTRGQTNAMIPCDHGTPVLTIKFSVICDQPGGVRYCSSHTHVAPWSNRLHVCL